MSFIAQISNYNKHLQTQISQGVLIDNEAIELLKIYLKIHDQQENVGEEGSSTQGYAQTSEENGEEGGEEGGESCSQSSRKQGGEEVSETSLQPNQGEDQNNHSWKVRQCRLRRSKQEIRSKGKRDGRKILRSFNRHGQTLCSSPSNALDVPVQNPRCFQPKHSILSFKESV